MAFFVHRYLPKTWTDLFTFCFLLFAIHSIGIFELVYILPKIYSVSPHKGKAYPWEYVHIFFGFFIYFHVMLNLYKVITTNTSTKGVLLPSILKPGWRFCYACESNAPPRSFHCHICKTCVLKRDHHCTFTGNCVGLTNQRYYLGLLFYLAAAAGYSCMLNIDFIYHLFGSLTWSSLFTIAVPLFSWIFIQSELSGFQVFMTSLSLMGLFMSLGLLAYHLVNVYHGQGVHEKANSILDYDLGWKENVKLVLGSRWKISWLSPIIHSPLPSDGLEFAKRGEHENIKNI